MFPSIARPFFRRPHVSAPSMRLQLGTVHVTRTGKTRGFAWLVDNRKETDGIAIPQTTRIHVGLPRIIQQTPASEKRRVVGPKPRGGPKFDPGSNTPTGKAVCGDDCTLSE